MRYRPLLATAAALVALAAVPPLQAQDLQTGVWTGTVTPPNEATLDVTYEVTREDGETKMTLHTQEHGDFACTNLLLKDDTLFFHWTPGTELVCELQRQDDGTFAGECVDDGGSPGQLVMVPPTEEK